MDWSRTLAPIHTRGLTTIFDLTNRCNLRCRQCYFSYDSVFYRPPVVLGPESFARLAQELLPRSKTVFLSATTEPLASPHFLRILEIAAAYHPIEIKLLTNATLLTETISEALVRHAAAEVQISIDGSTANTFERIRRGARFGRFVRNVAGLTNAKRRHGATAPLLQFNVTLMRSNLDELPGIVDIAAALGVQRIGCRHVVPYDGLGMEAESLSREPLRANQGLAAMLARAAAAGVAIVNFPDYFAIDGQPWRPPPGRATPVPSRGESMPAAGPGADLRFEAGPLGRLDGPTAAEFDSPGHLDLHGWALDSNGAVEVRIEREQFPDEGRGDSRNERVLLGKAEFQNGRRPDVVAVFSGVPGVQGAGWVFQGRVPDTGWKSGTTMVIHAVAENSAGKCRVIGSRRVVRRSEVEAAPWLYCHRPFSYIFVNAAGSLFPYPDCQGSDTYGVLDPQVRFEDLWFGEVATELRRRIIDRDPPEMCQRCPIFINRLVSDPKVFEPRDTQSRYRLPIGCIEQPGGDRSCDAMEIEIQGWTLGFALVERVEIECQTGTEAAGPARFVVLGTAEFSDEPRPDLAARDRKIPHTQRPVWRFTLRRSDLAGPGPHRVRAVAVSCDGGRSSLGTRELTFRAQDAPPPNDGKNLDRERIEATEDLVERARRVLPYESFDWIVRRPLHGDDGFVFPLFAAEANGCEIVDTTGRSFIDWANGWGCNLLGYRHPAVEAAICAQLVAGPLVSLTHSIEIEVAELIAALVPGAEMAAFCKTGTDAIAGAVRVARAATGRPVVLQHGLMNFRAWQQTRAAADPRQADATSIVEFPYDDLGILEELLEAHRGRVAAILMEPVRDELPHDGYLAGVRRLADEHGAVLILDEVVTNFRVARGGAQEYYGVTADLVCLGKAIANGMPLAALAGKRALMRLVTAVSFDSTFRGETLSLAAAAATLRVVRDEPVAEHLARAGSELRDCFDARCKELGVVAALNGPPARMSVHFEPVGSRTSRDLCELFLQECMKRGVLTTGHFLASYAHDEKALGRTSDCVGGAIAVVADALASERAGRPGPRACRSSGYLNVALEPHSDELRIWGWMLLEHRAADSVEIVAPDGSRLPADLVARPELAVLYPNIAGAGGGGYQAKLPASKFAPNGLWTFTICASSEERVAFLCRVRQRSPSSFPGEPRSTSDGTLLL